MANIKLSLQCCVSINTYMFSYKSALGGRGGLVVNASDSGSGVRAPLGSKRVVSLSKAHLLPKSTGNTQEAVAPSQHD